MPQIKQNLDKENGKRTLEDLYALQEKQLKSQENFQKLLTKSLSYDFKSRSSKSTIDDEKEKRAKLATEKAESILRERLAKEQLSIEKMAEQRRKMEVALKKDALTMQNKQISNQKALLSLQYMQDTSKQPDNDTYKKTMLYKVGSNIKSQESSGLASTALSIMSGGIINPVMAQTLGLDKVLSAAFFKSFRALGNALGTGEAGDKAKRKRDSSAVDIANDKNTSMREDVKTIKDVLTNRQAPEDKEKTKNEKDASTNPAIQMLKKVVMGLGLAFMAVKSGLMNFLGEKISELGSKITQLIGGGKEVGDVAGGMLKDALPGAILGLPFGLKGVFVGGALSLVGNSLQKFKKMFSGGFDEEGKPNSDALGWGETLARGAISGGILGALIPGAGIKGIGIGIILGALGGVIMKAIGKIRDWWENLNVADTAKDIGDSTLRIVGGEAGAWVSDKLGWSKKAREEAKRETNWVEARKKQAQYDAKQAETINKIGATNYLQLYGNGDVNKMNTTERRAYWNYLRDHPMEYTPIGTGNDINGGGYGSFNASSYNSDDVIIHNRPATSLESMSLSGDIASTNSIPYVAEQNVSSLKNLDNALDSWGYDVIYTSAMGGHRPGTGHWKGNKVDLQLKKNGKPAHLNGGQLTALRDAGYWGSGTGALGWEPVRGQVGGGHYDLFLGNGGGSISTNETRYASNYNFGNIGKASEQSFDMKSESVSTPMDEVNDSLNNMGELMVENMNNQDATAGLSSGGGTNYAQAASAPIIINNSTGSSGDTSIYATGDVARSMILGVI